MNNDGVLENLKAIKVLHQLLMAVTAAVFVFVLRPDLTQEYKNALDELAALKQVSLGGWSNYVAHRYRTDLDQDKKLLRSWLREAGLNVRRDAQGPVFPVFGDQVPFPGTGRLLDLDTFFSKVQTIGVTKVDAAERLHFLDQVAKWKGAHNPNATITMLNLSANSSVQYFDGSPMLDWLNRSPSAMSNFPLYLNTDEQPLQQPGFVVLTYSIQSETGSFALDWLRNDALGQRIVDAKTGNVFPRLKVFWHQVNQDGPDQAVVFLQEEMAANARGTLSFFGISVERSHAVLAGPVAVFCILLFMALHLMHFRSLSPSNDTIRSYPWVALFHGWPATSVADASILVLPAIADGTLLYRFGQTAEWSTRVGAIAACFALVEGLWVLFEVTKIRRQSRLRGD